MNILGFGLLLYIFPIVWELASTSPSYNSYRNLDTVIIPLELDAKKLECVHQCVANVKNLGKLYGCYKFCQDPPERGDDLTEEKVRQNSTYDIGLICRDDTSLTVMVNVSDATDPDETIVVLYRVSDGQQETFYLSNNPFGLIDMLKSGKKYNISGSGYKGGMHEISEQFQLNAATFSTLVTQHPTKEITNIEVLNYRTAPGCSSCLYADVLWTPTADYICHYSIAWHDNYNGDLHEIPLIVELAIQPQYKITIGDLQFGSEYKVAVRSFMHFSEQSTDDFNWKTFTTPQCREMYTEAQDIMQMCPPLQPANVAIKSELTGKSLYNIQVLWDKPEPPQPHNYRITIRTLNTHDPVTVISTVEGNQTHVDFRKIAIPQLDIEITVEAFYANGKHTYTSIAKKVPQRENRAHSSLKILIGVASLALISVIIFCSLFDYSVWPCTKSRTVAARVQYQADQSPNIEMRRYRTVVVDESDREEDATPNCYIDDSFEISIEDVTIGDKINVGHYGKVRKGVFLDDDCNEIDVAVKKLKKLYYRQDDVMEFIEEIKMLKSIPKHRNILSVVGHCTVKETDQILMTEYCAKGSLLQYLRNEWISHTNKQAEWRSDLSQPKVVQSSGGKSCSVHVNAVTNAAFEEDDSDDFVIMDETYLTIKSLVDIAVQIAEGMKFLGDNKVIHRDLAARNILIDADDVVKITDFGFKRPLRHIYDSEFTKSNQRVPLKWMALEVLMHKLYTIEADVWSFGIVLYEILTLGCIPYATVENNNLYIYLLSGSRLEKPPNCSENLYQLMKSCWEEEPNERPSFETIISKLIEERNSLSGDDIVDLDKLGEDEALVRDIPAKCSTHLIPKGGKSQYIALEDSDYSDDFDSDYE